MHFNKPNRKDIRETSFKFNKLPSYAQYRNSLTQEMTVLVKFK